MSTTGNWYKPAVIKRIRLSIWIVLILIAGLMVWFNYPFLQNIFNNIL